MKDDAGRILAVDPGEKRLGIAVSDPTQTIATALKVIDHQSREKNARNILDLAHEQAAVLILIGHPLNWDGTRNTQSDRSNRLKEEILLHGDLPVKLWDEYGSTQTAQNSRRKMNVSRKKRAGHLDDVAAVVILQSYLDHYNDQGEE